MRKILKYDDNGIAEIFEPPNFIGKYKNDFLAFKLSTYGFHYITWDDYEADNLYKNLETTMQNKKIKVFIDLEGKILRQFYMFDDKMVEIK